MGDSTNSGETKRSTAGAVRTGRAALWMSEDEADALLTLLLHVPATTPVPAETADRLLCRVAQVQRELVRAELPSGQTDSAPTKRAVAATRSLIVRRRRRRIVNLSA